MENTYKNILILNLRKIGDTIMATSTAYLLKKAYPKAKLTMLVKPLTKAIVENNPVIDEVLLYNYSHKAKIAEIIQTAKMLKEKQFDLAVVVDNKPRSALLSWMSGIPQRIGFEKITLRNIYLRLFYTKIYKIDYDFLSVQQVKNHEIFINRITGKNDKAQMIMPDIDMKSKAKVDALLDKLPDNKNKIALCIKSGVPFKDWPQENFIEVVETLSQKYNAAFFIIGAPNDSDYAENFIDKCNADIHNFCGMTNLPELGYLLSQADLLLTVDTGTAHIAAAVDTRQVVVFAGTSHYHWAPYGDNVEIVYPDVVCYPCDDKTRKQCNNYKCLQNISIKQVVEKSCQILNNL